MKRLTVQEIEDMEMFEIAKKFIKEFENVAMEIRFNSDIDADYIRKELEKVICNFDVGERAKRYVVNMTCSQCLMEIDIDELIVAELFCYYLRRA